MNNHPTLHDTFLLVKEAHGQNNAMDKGGETPYYWHLLRVMLRLGHCNENVLHIALLHDVVEDTSITLKDLEAKGYNPTIIEGVRWCSKNMFPELTFAQWMQTFGQEAPEDAVLVKLADISDNLGFERMNGLRAKGFEKKKTTPAKPKKSLSLREKVDRKVSQKMRLNGEMGVFTRYYQAWNLILENESHLPLVNQVYTGDFCKLEQLQQLASFLPPEELKTYLHNNRHNSWTISGTMQMHRDKANQPYLAVEIPQKMGEFYQHYLQTQIPGEFIQAQQIRDKESFHITFINAAQFGGLNKNQPEVLEKLCAKAVGKNFEFFTYGIGTAINPKKEQQAWFVIAENAFLATLREHLGFSPQDYHLTLGFSKADVHGFRKNRETLSYNNQAIWDNWCDMLALSNKNLNKKKVG